MNSPVSLLVGRLVSRFIIISKNGSEVTLPMLLSEHLFHSGLTDLLVIHISEGRKFSNRLFVRVEWIDYTAREKAIWQLKYEASSFYKK